MPPSVIRSTTYDGTRVGGIWGTGGCAACVGDCPAVACAATAVAINMGTTANTVQVMSLPRSVLHISSSVFISNVCQGLRNVTILARNNASHKKEGASSNHGTVTCVFVVKSAMELPRLMQLRRNWRCDRWAPRGLELQ